MTSNKPAAQRTNPIVAKAAASVRKPRPKRKDLHETCRNQLALFELASEGRASK